MAIEYSTTHNEQWARAQRRMHRPAPADNERFPGISNACFISNVVRQQDIIYTFSTYNLNSSKWPKLVQKYYF